MPACTDCSALMSDASSRPHGALRQVGSSYGPGAATFKEYRAIYSCVACGARLAYRITIGNPWANGWELLREATDRAPEAGTPTD